jgi:hypothetical protein
MFVRYLQQGFAEREAQHKALSEVKGYLGIGGASAVRLLSAGSGQRANEQPDSVKGKVRAYLTSNPDAAQMSVNQLLSALSGQGVRAGRTTVAEVLQEVRKEQER